MRAFIALSRKISTNFSGNCARPAACACTSASSDSQSCHRKCPRKQAARGARCRGQAQGRMEAGVGQEGRRKQSTGGILCHCSRQAGGRRGGTGLHRRFNPICSLLHVVYTVSLLRRHQSVGPDHGNLLRQKARLSSWTKIRSRTQVRVAGSSFKFCPPLPAVTLLQ